MNDPRLNNIVSEADLKKQAELAANVQTDIDNLHRAVNQIRSIRASLPKQVGTGSPNSEILAVAKALDAKMIPVEETLVQVKMKSSEGNLRYPNMLNEQYWSFNELIQSFDQAPTASQLEVYNELHTRLTTELVKWQQIQSNDVVALNDLLRKNGAPSVTVGTGLAE